MPLPADVSEEIGSCPTRGEALQPQAAVALQAGPSLWRIADFIVLGIWTGVVGFTLQHHEKWADEAQAWLLARDLDLYTLWFKELRYEGSPGLWHTILWFAQRVFHAPYSSMGIIGMVFAAGGVALMLFKAPFPRPLRWLLAFSYFMVYQYAVIARPYTLLPLLCFSAAILFNDREHPERMTAVLALLSLLTVHGILIAGGIGAAYLIAVAKDWSSLRLPLRRRYLACIGVMLLTLVLLFLVLKPTPDVAEFAVRKDPLSQNRIWEPPKSAKLVSVLSGAFLDFTLPSSIFLLLSGAWCRMRHRLLAFALPCALLILLYVFIHGLSHHHGTLFVAAVTGLWIAWPAREEQPILSLGQRRATKAMVALMVCLFAINMWDAAVSIRYEYLYPYSGAEDAARYLKLVGADKQSIFGYTYGMAAVQAYFDRNILANIPTTYYHEGMPLYGRDLDFAELAAQRPEYVIFLTGNPNRELKMFDPLLNRYGYALVHFSDGYLFFKRSLMDRQVYAIYQRMH